MDKETTGERPDVRLSVNIDVDDLAKGTDFYRRALGLRPGRLLFGGTVAELLGAPMPVYLLAKAPGSRAVPGFPLLRDYGRHWTPVHLDFEVDDLAAAVARAVAAGARVEGKVRAFPWGRLATLSDPFGHGFCLLQFTGEGYE